VDVPNCDIIGRIPLAQVGDYYRRASIFCLPTKLEPFGIVFLEAFSYKLPIVATNVGAIPDFVVPGENGYLVVSGESKTLAAALLELLDDPEQCRTFGEKGYKLVQENYTWDKVGSRMREQIMADLSGKLVTSQGHC
jgi:glycosyltransferase involved in cell wall biosynthesis